MIPLLRSIWILFEASWLTRRAFSVYGHLSFRDLLVSNNAESLMVSSQLSDRLCLLPSQRSI